VRHKTSPPQPLKEAVKEHFKEISLSGSQLSQLQLLLNSHQEATEVETTQSAEATEAYQQTASSQVGIGIDEPDAPISATSPSSWFTKLPLYLPIAAAAVALFVFFGPLREHHEPLGPFAKRVVKEVSKNHIKGKPAKILTADLKIIQKRLTKLKFSIIASKQLPTKRWTVKGGKYCSIQGERAVQLSLWNRQNQSRYTLYQVPIPTELAKQKKALKGLYKGVQVNIWKEKGLLLVLAGKPFSQ